MSLPRYSDTMTGHGDEPHGQAELDELRAEIDALKSVPEEQLISPVPADLLDREPTPHPTNAIGSEKWDVPVDEETLDD